MIIVPSNPIKPSSPSYAPI